MGTAPWAQFGQKIPAGQVGKTYTLAVFVRSVGEPVSVRLEVERAGSPWDRAARGEDTKVGPDQWTELHITFAVEKPFPEGWQAYLHCGQEGGRLRVDLFRLYEGGYVPGRPNAPEPRRSTAGRNLLANPELRSRHGAVVLHVADRAAEPAADVPPSLVPGDASAGQHGRQRRDTAAVPDLPHRPAGWPGNR